MKMFPKLLSLLAVFCCLCLLSGCDRIFKRQVSIDFQNHKAKSFAVAAPGDLDKFFSRLEGIARKNGLTCRPYDVVRKSYACRGGTVSLVTYVTAGKAVRIELTQFGPWEKTEAFAAIEKDLTDFIGEEFPGQAVRMTNPFN
jgi:hypothetical protein